MDIGCLEKHNLSTALLENSRKLHGIAVNSHKGRNTFTSFHVPSRDMCGWSMHCACVV